MSAKIPVQVHIGVTPLIHTPAGQDYAGTRVTITGQSGDSQESMLQPGDVPVPDAGGNLAYTVAFSDVQSGEVLHVEVEALDSVGATLGVAVTHDAPIAAVPDDPAAMYHAPQSIYVTVA